MSRLRPINVRRRKFDDDDLAPGLGTSRARQEALRDCFDLDDELRSDDEDRPSTSYRHPVD